MMRHPDEQFGTPMGREGTLPIDFGDEDVLLAREVHVDGTTVVSDEAGEEHRLADVLPHGQVGIEAAYAQMRPTFERDFAAQREQSEAAQQQGRTFAQAEPNYRAGFTAGRDLRYADQTFEAIETELRREYESSIAAETGGGTTERERSWERMRAEIQRGFQEARRHD